MTIQIRQAKIKDSRTILDFIIELAIYEKAKDQVKTDIKQLESTLFCENAKANALICEMNDQAIGYAVYFYNYSTWLGKPGLFLEDLYITPKHRGCGAGKKLFKYLAKLALSEDCGRFEWNVLDWNQPAIDFYESCGGQAQKEWIGYRLSGNTLNDFANS